MRRLPKVGQLIRINHYSPTRNSLFVSSCDGKSEIEVDNGTIALVVGHMVRGEKNHNSLVTVIIVKEFVGWIFDDEWKVIESCDAHM